MMKTAGRSIAQLSGLLLLLAAACNSPAPTLPTAQASAPTNITSPNAPLHAAEIRFALIGNVTAANVWALFDSTGYSYNNYSVRSGYWPRLYHASIPEGQFEPQAAAGMPSPFEAEGELFTATVPLRTDLKWSDGTPFTANDVAFTVNTALDFQLGFDWSAHYNRDWIDHATAVDAHTVKFYFKRTPDVGMWQYGALQGPVVQQKYWAPKIEEPLALLPRAQDAAEIQTLTQKAADLQKRVDALVAEGVTASGEQAHQLQLELKRRQGDLDEARNDLSKAQTALDNAMESARQTLYALDETAEPTLGEWMPGAEDNGKWVNEANPAHPFGEPHFDRAVYAFYPDEGAGVAALKNGEVNEVLEFNGLSAPSRADLGASIISNQNSAAYFLVINPSSTKLADPALRLALFCSVSPTALASAPVTALPLSSFVIPTNIAWYNPAGSISCGDAYDAIAKYDPTKAARLLQSAGYTWTTEPTSEQAGSGLKTPDGKPLPPITLLAPSEKENAQSIQAALVVEHYANYLGIPVSVQPVASSTIRYSMFNDRKYDVAIVGWRLSEYPGYLCDWFGGQNPFGYHDRQLDLICQKLAATADLGATRALVSQIQERLGQKLPFIPVYSGVTYDAYEGIQYSFQHVLDGLSGVYGAPSVASPKAP
jgi:peptide/nickel transport system substrate-binding protein